MRCFLFQKSANAPAYDSEPMKAATQRTILFDLCIQAVPVGVLCLFVGHLANLDFFWQPLPRRCGNLLRSGVHELVVTADEHRAVLL